jgi:hypothetical protein
MIPSTKAVIAAKAWSLIAGEASSSGAKVKASPQLQAVLAEKHIIAAIASMPDGQKIGKAIIN